MAARPDIAPDGKSNRPSTKRDDLERYGVWVKAEPQDITPEPEISVDDLGLPEESFLTEEEERLLGSFEEGDSAAMETGVKTSSSEGEDIFASLPEIEDFEPSQGDGSGSLDAKARGKEIEDSEFELSMEDLSSGFSEPSIGPGSPIDLSSVEGLEEPDAPRESPALTEFDLPDEADFKEPKVGGPRNKAEAPAGGQEIEDVSMEFLDVGGSDPTSGQSVAKKVDDVTDEFLVSDGGEAAELSPKDASTSDFEPLDIELHFDDEAAAPAPVDHASAGFEELGEFDGILDSKEPEESFDDIAAFEKDLAEEPSAGPEATETRRHPEHPTAQGDSGLANELLLKIANELSSIRSELVTLKSELVSARTSELPPAVAEPETAQAAESGGGFFDEEDDEKIALTGDELDNILSSADFTEEAPSEGYASEREIAAEGEIQLAAGGFEAEDILPESGEYPPPAEEAVERISLEEEAVEPAVAGENAPTAVLEDEVIARLADEGIAPLTPAPEDTSYLEEPLAEEQVLDMPETPFVEAPLVEPDLSELSIDLSPDEGELDVSGELPVMEEEFPDITLDLDAAAPLEALESESTLALDEETLPEFEDELAYEDISLAVESETALPIPHEEETVEELGDLTIAELPPEDELHHEDLGVSQAVGSGSSIPSLELDEDLFVPSPASKPQAEINLSARPEAQGPEELIEIDEAEEFADVDLEEALQSEPAFTPIAEPTKPEAAAAPSADQTEKLKSDIRSVLSYLDRLLESLPEDKIEEFAHSEHFDTYKKLFEELGLV